MIGASTSPTTYPNAYYQCDTLGNPLASNPDGSQPQGTACNKIPQGQINNIGQAMINLYPAPNANNPSAGYNYVNVPVRQLDNTKFDARLDQTFSTRTLPSAVSAMTRHSPMCRAARILRSLPRPTLSAPISASSITRATPASAKPTSSRATMVNQATFGYNRIFDYISSQGTGTCASYNLGIPGANLGCPSGTCIPGAYSCGLVSTEFSANYWALGDRGYAPFQGGTNIFSFRDDLDIILGKHDLHVGIDFRRNQMNVGTEAFQDGFWLVGETGFTYTGNPESDFLLGLTGGAIHDQTYGGVVTGRRWSIYRPFVEDDWRVTPSLVLNLGLAWDLTTPTTEAHGRLANYVPATGQLLIANQNGVSSSAGVNMDLTALEPRVGASWKVFGSDKMVLRGGYALYHDSAWSQGAQGLWQNPPFLGETDNFPAFSPACPTYATSSSTVPSFCSTLPVNAGATVIPAGLSLGFASPPTPGTAANFEGTFYTEPTNLKLGRVQQFNVNLQHATGRQPHFDHGICRFPRHPHPGGWQFREREQSLGLRHHPQLHHRLPRQRRVLFLPLLPAQLQRH